MARLKMDINTYEARVSIRTLYEATQMVRKGALTNDVITATFRIYDTKFNQYMAGAAKKGMSHMYDWGMVGSPTGRLWKTIIGGTGAGKIASFQFVNSKKKVPHDPGVPQLRRRHVFKKKAEMMEKGETVNISPKYAKMLAYINRHKGAGGVDEEPGSKSFQKGGITFTQRTSTILLANGKFEGKFNAAFIAFWTSLGPKQQIADFLAKSTSFHMARAAATRKRMSMQQGKATAMSSTPEAKRRAEQAIAGIKRDMKKKV